MTYTQGRLKLVIDTPHSAVIETAATGYAVAEPCRWGSITDSDEQIANARRLVACWNACIDIDTDTLVELGPETTLVKIAIKALEKVDEALMRNAELLAALKEAATSLETLSILSGRKTFGQPPIETYMEDFMQVRGYANSRMTVARAAIAKAEGGAA